MGTLLSAGAGVRQPVISATPGASHQQKPRFAGHPNCFCEPHPGPWIYILLRKTVLSRSLLEKIKCLFYRIGGVAQERSGALLRQQGVLRDVRPLPLLPLPGAQGDQQLRVDPPVHARTQ